LSTFGASAAKPQDESLFLAVWSICSAHEKHCAAISINSAEYTLAEVIVRYCNDHTVMTFWKSLPRKTRQYLCSAKTDQSIQLIDAMITNRDQDTVDSWLDKP
jgi:hypothetical protein